MPTVNSPFSQTNQILGLLLEIKLKPFSDESEMRIILDLFDSPDKNDFVDAAAIAECESTWEIIGEEQAENSFSEGEDRSEEAFQFSMPCHARYPPPSQTPIYDFYMREAGKGIGDEEKVFRECPRRRSFGRQKRRLQNFMNAAEELRQDIDRAWKTMLEDDLWGTIEYYIVADEAKKNGEMTVARGSAVFEVDEEKRKEGEEKWRTWYEETDENSTGTRYEGKNP